MASFYDLLQKARQRNTIGRQSFQQRDIVGSTIDAIKYLDTRDRENIVHVNSQVQNIPSLLQSITGQESYDRLLPVINDIKSNAAGSNKTSMYVPYIEQLQTEKLNNITNFNNAVSDASDYINKVGRGKEAYSHFDEMTINDLRDEIRKIESINHHLNAGITTNLKNNEGLYSDSLLAKDMDDYINRLDSTTKALVTGGVITPEELEAIWLGTDDQYNAKRTEAKKRAERAITSGGKSISSLNNALTRFISAQAKKSTDPNSYYGVVQNIVDDAFSEDDEMDSTTLSNMTPAAFEDYIIKRKKYILQLQIQLKI